MKESLFTKKSKEYILVSSAFTWKALDHHPLGHLCLHPSQRQLSEGDEFYAHFLSKPILERLSHKWHIAPYLRSGSVDSPWPMSIRLR